MNPYQKLLLESMMGQQPQATPIPTGVAAFKQGEVAENIGADKLAKKQYNPYGNLLNKEEKQGHEDPAQVQRKNFRKELLKDQTEQ